ncbi:MAG TPA: hypothetical protein VF690_05205 [Hymenobacter sp.]|jgi:hypothetical protein
MFSLYAPGRCAVGLVYARRHRLELTETALWQHGFRAKCVPLADTTALADNLGAYVVQSPRTTIRLTTDSHDQLGLKKRLVAQLQALDAAKNPLPGRRLSPDDQEKLFVQVHHVVETGTRTDTLFAADPALFAQLTKPAYYLVYEHPVRAFLHRAYDAEGPPVHTFLARRRRTEAAIAPGMNLFLLPRDLDWLLVYLDDGNIVVKPAVDR